MGWRVGEYRAEDVRDACGRDAVSCSRRRMGDVAMRSPLTGRVNVYNLLAAHVRRLARGLTLEEIVAGAEAGAQVPGRFEVVPFDEWCDGGGGLCAYG